MNPKYILALLCLLLLLSCAFAQDSEIGIEFIKPERGVRFEKGDTIEVEVEITFPEGAQHKMVVGSWGTGGGVMDIELTLNDAGNYEGQIETSQEISGLRINVFARADIGGMGIDSQEEIPVNFVSLELMADAEFIPPGPYYLGSTIEKIRIDVSYPDGSKVPLENLVDPGYRIGMDSGRLNLTEEDGSLVAELNYKIELNEQFLREGFGRLEFEMYNIRDEFNNEANSIRKDIMVEKEHDSLRVKTKGLSSYTRLFHDMDYAFVIELQKGDDVENESVQITDTRDLENRRECQKVSDEGEKAAYECVEKTPSMEEGGKMTYIALATATVSGRDVTVYQILELEVSNKVHLDNQYPMDMVALDELENEIEVNFYYNENGKLEGGSYSGTVNDISVEFVWNAEEDAYVAEFDLLSLGEGRHDLEFAVEGLNLENDYVSVEILPEGTIVGPGPNGKTGEGGGIDMILIIIAMFVVLALFTFMIWVMVLRKKKAETIDELKEEQATMKALLKKIEIDFYKRRLNEVEFKKMSLEAQTRLEKVTAKLNAKGTLKKEKQK